MYVVVCACVPSLAAKPPHPPHLALLLMKRTLSICLASQSSSSLTVERRSSVNVLVKSYLCYDDGSVYMRTYKQQVIPERLDKPDLTLRGQSVSQVTILPLLCHKQLGRSEAWDEISQEWLTPVLAGVWQHVNALRMKYKLAVTGGWLEADPCRGESVTAAGPVLVHLSLLHRHPGNAGGAGDDAAAPPPRPHGRCCHG